MKKLINIILLIIFLQISSIANCYINEAPPIIIERVPNSYMSHNKENLTRFYTRKELINIILNLQDKNIRLKRKLIRCRMYHKLHR